MDDLNGLDWSATPNQSKVPPGTGNYYPTLRPTPPPVTSGRSTPLSAQPSAVPKAFAAPKSSTPDSFSNLVSFGSSKSTTLTLQQQQEKLQAEKKRQEEEKKKQYDAQFGNGQFWDGLGNKAQGFAGIPPATSRPTVPSVASPFRPLSPPTANGVSVTGTGEDEDLFAAFNSKTKVDSSSHYPAPSNPTSGRNTPGFSTNKIDLTNPQAWEKPSTPLSGVGLGDDDDPFGLGQMSMRNTAPAPTTTVDDDDFLGDLGKPVEEVRRPVKASPAPKPTEESDSDSDSEPETNDPWDKAVAELVEMGFSAQNSRRALTESGSGLDIQAAVGWLLNDAHRQAKEKQQKREPSGNNGTTSERRDRAREGARSKANPAWMDEEGRERSQPKREDNRSPASGDDFSKAAAAVGSNLFKTANSLWKTSQKTVKKAVAELQYDSTGGDPSQPKWMREAAEREAQERNGGRRAGKARAEPEVTDEALMLEAGSGPPQRKPRAAEQRYPPSSSDSSRDASPAFSERPSQSQPPRWQQTKPATPLDAKSRLSKQAIEDDAAKAYVSSARRKKPTPKLQPQEPEPDLFSTAPSQPSSQPKPASSRPTPRSTPIPSKPSTPIPTRPKAPPRTIPHLSSIALQSSNQHRLAGTTHFKRGDYAAAHTSYTASLSSLPPNHPITVILFCNRALTSLKTGVPRAAVEDADKAMVIIGVARGDGETIDLGNGETKEMKEFWGKALMRKAEALEQMEQWKNAGAVWQEAVEAGVGGATSIQGRQRCEKALAPKAAPRTATPKPRPAPKPRSALSDLGGSKDSEAVERLRAANIAAEKADDEKFALADSVDARISQWRDGKRDNLRALLGSLDKVLWEGSGWNKVGMHELVINSKVKIAYMKAIGKCHPDKLPQDASTEIKLIAATVFSTLNESWDKFKAENGM